MGPHIIYSKAPKGQYYGLKPYGYYGAIKLMNEEICALHKIGPFSFIHKSPLNGAETPIICIPPGRFIPVDSWEEYLATLKNGEE